ncbi:MAG TPA: ribosome biogenesis GTPase Der [Polyangiaceae bacterium]|nr:ribosome biogenesis GTPase Der [Polyangiaceae bacterium]
MNPIVAIVGRPNVGKSTLFNRLVGRSLAIVDDQPGVTRDRHYAPAHLYGRNVTLIDTGGFDLTSGDPLQQGIARQVQAAIDEADVIVCVLDGTSAPMQPDREAVELLRRADKPVIYVANKVDTAGHLAAAQELYELGIPDLLPVSGLHGRGTAELGEAITRFIAPVPSEPELRDEAPRIALLGRPNAGKSSLFNRLVGEERALVDDQPGTTRDPVDTHVSWGGREFVLVDTAGIRRRARVERGIELVSVMRSLRAVERAHIVVLLCDATEGPAEQDARLLGLTIDRRRAVIIGLNKVDLLSREERKKAVEHARDSVTFASWAPLVELSARTGSGVSELMKAVAKAADEMQRRIPTAALNRFFAEVLERQPPPTHGGKAPRIYYITQVETAPPLFVASSNAPDAIKPSYQRFVTNQIRKAFGFESVPIRVEYRQRNRRGSQSR